jgi:SAM-dependent methyltransferase
MLEKIRSVLELPQAYQLYWTLIGGAERSRILVRDYIRPRQGDRILEIGCGPGTIVPYLPQGEYVGFDANCEYIEKASHRFPHAKFICENVSDYSLSQKSYFDIVLALGIVHHLNDEQSVQLFRVAHDALRPGGRMVTLDGVWTNGQSRTERYLLAKDRGRFVRDEAGYLSLAAKVFSQIKSHLRPHLLRIPYTHIIMECTR